MNAELEKKLTEKYPELFIDKNLSPKETLICFGCECGDGWYKILDYLFGYLDEMMNRSIHVDYTEAYKKLHKNKKDYYENYYSYKHRPPQIRLTQVKEKFGTLRVYYTFDYTDLPEEIKPSVKLEELNEKLERYYTAVDNAIDFAEYQSSVTCEVTGGDGKLYTKGWHRVLCDEEARKAGYDPAQS